MLIAAIKEITLTDVHTCTHQYIVFVCELAVSWSHVKVENCFSLQNTFTIKSCVPLVQT